MNQDMDWDESTRSFVPRAQPSLNFLYNYNMPYPGMEVKQAEMLETTPHGLLINQTMEELKYGKQREKKKRLTSKQIESLERSFQEEIKLDTDRKMKLSRELGLQPRQIAVWFQNRRTRWKAKQLEHLYLSLKQQFDHISQEKHNLQQEVMKLKAMLREQGLRTQISGGGGGGGGYTEMSGKETVESTSEMLRGSNKSRGMINNNNNNNNQMIGDGYCSFTVDDYSTVPPLPHWTTVPHCP